MSADDEALTLMLRGSNIRRHSQEERGRNRKKFGSGLRFCDSQLAAIANAVGASLCPRTPNFALSPARELLIILDWWSRGIRNMPLCRRT
jgi:hypothetical protein